MNFDTQLSDSSAAEMRESVEVIPVPDSSGREAFLIERLGVFTCITNLIRAHFHEQCFFAKFGSKEKYGGVN